MVAEGVEREEQYDYLSEIGCDQAQGYFLSHPLPADEVIAKILEINSKAS